MKAFKSLRPDLKVLSRLVRHDAGFSTQWPEEPLDLPVDRKGGFYPAVLGTKLHSRYTIVQKLGWGRHSNVWLVKDEKQHQMQYVAVKILTAHATQAQRQLANELGLLRRVQNLAEKSRNPGRDHVITLIDSFEVSSSHGSHLCLVHQAMGKFSTIDSRGLPIPLVKILAKQLLLALDFLHRECNVVHTDIKPDNILVKLVNVATATELDNERSSVFITSSELPSNAILSRPLRVLAPDDLLEMNKISELNVQLSDFGTAAAADGPHAAVIQPPALRAPEVILGCEWGPSADIWNLGCLIFEFLTGHWLFVPRGGPTWTAEAYHLAHMPAITSEQFDTSYFRTGKHFGDYFDDNGKLRIQVQGIRGLEEALKSYNVIDDDEMSFCVSFLRSMLRLIPSDRASAADLAQHRWLHI
jgi:serine/threonine-protein kinase SRPK3